MLARFRAPTAKQHKVGSTDKITTISLVTLVKAREIALAQGLQNVYTGNVHNREGDTTYCPGCGKPVIERDWYELTGWHLSAAGHCLHCGTAVAGRFDSEPGNWGRKRVGVRFSE